MEAAFRVVGTPKPKGSTRAFVHRGRAIITSDCKGERPWAQQVHWTAREHAFETPWSGPVRVEVEFIMPRPKRLGRKRVDVPADTKPDVDKLARSVLDALTGVFWVDDSTVTALFAMKRHANEGEAPGALIRVETVQGVAA